MQSWKRIERTFSSDTDSLGGNAGSSSSSSSSRDKKLGKNLRITEEDLYGVGLASEDATGSQPSEKKSSAEKKKVITDPLDQKKDCDTSDEEQDNLSIFSDTHGYFSIAKAKRKKSTSTVSKLKLLGEKVCIKASHSPQK